STDSYSILSLPPTSPLLPYTTLFRSSTSLPESVQYDLLKTIPGLEDVEMMRSGYAIEYDSVIPTQLYPTLESKQVQGLFTAGQIDRKSTRLNSSHVSISYAVFCLKKK